MKATTKVNAHDITTTNKSSFDTLLRNYEKQTVTDTTTKEYADSLQELATAITYSVLKKCIEVSQNAQLKTVRRSIARDTNMLTTIDYDNANAYKMTYTQDGDIKLEVNDTNARDGLHTLIGQTLGDGLDLVNTAIIAILDETSKADTSEPLFMEMPYQVRRLKRKVWIKLEDSVDGWETVDTTPIQEVFKAVRREIESSRAMKANTANGYTYIDDLAHDSDSDTDAVIYRRLPKYADLGGYATDFNGATTLYSADKQVVADTDDIICNLQLTAKQAKILQLRLSGYGYKAIATYLGITQRAVAKTVQAIQKKAVESCQFDDKLLNRYMGTK